jgi:adenylate kinase family enzyme
VRLKQTKRGGCVAKQIKGIEGQFEPLPIKHLPKTAYIYIGPPVCGKDSQTEPYEKHLGIPVFKTGPVLKKSVDRDPESTESKAIKKGNLASDGLTLWLAKIWILDHTIHKIIKLNGIPRNIKQMVVIVEFLRERGFNPKIIWFTTPLKVCVERPFRPDRLEDTPENRAQRMSVFQRQTLPMFKEFKRYGISEDSGNLLCIDNSEIQKQEVAKQIIGYFGLPYQVSQLFPPVSNALETGRNAMLTTTV